MLTLTNVQCFQCFMLTIWLRIISTSFLLCFLSATDGSSESCAVFKKKLVKYLKKRLYKGLKSVQRRKKKRNKAKYIYEKNSAFILVNAISKTFKQNRWISKWNYGEYLMLNSKNVHYRIKVCTWLCFSSQTLVLHKKDDEILLWNSNLLK